VPTDLLQGLNEAQRRAVEAPDGPLLIFAGAGSGKTRVLTHRIAHLIATGRAAPSEILAVTFTNKAAREMRTRVEQLVGEGISGMWLGTFHAIGARLLRRDGESIGVPATFVIYDEADRAVALRRASEAAGVDPKRYPPAQIGHAISAAKNELLDAAGYAASPDARGYLGAQVAKVFTAYEREMSAAGALDFDDLLLKSVQLLRDVEPLRDHYNERFRHVLVDEYQDTNHAQYVMVALLTEQRRNLTVVGDDDQCLLAGTPVTMADGSLRPIEEVRVGDSVRSCYGSGDFRPATVVRTARREASAGIRITTQAGRTLVSTPEHTHFAADPRRCEIASSRGRLAVRHATSAVARALDQLGLPALPAAAVQPGMVMFDEAGGYDVVEAVERVRLERPVHDIDVEPTHNFVAAGIVTHNSIYGWRGADVRNILDFERDHPDATVVTLDQNYRSTQGILDAAHAVIRNNRDRAPKKLWTDAGTGERVQLISVYDEQEEALTICAEIDRLVASEGVSLADCAVLYRTNAQSRALEDVMLRRGMPYRLVGGQRFYERREIKDVLAYLRLISNPRDAVSFGRIVNVPRRKIGDKTVAEIERLARRRGVTPFEAVATLLPDAEGINAGAAAALEGFHRLIEGLRAASTALPLPELVERVLTDTGYREHLRDGTPEGEERWANVTELTGLAAEHAELEPPAGLTRFLEQVALVSDVDSLDGGGAGVTLITLHQVKGLEFPVVFIAGLEEGLLPHIRALEAGESGIAEERRLTYVGITRAQRRLYLLHAFRRHLHGAPQLAAASRFLDELPKELLDVPVRPGAGVPANPRAAGAVRAALHAHAVRPNPVEVAPQRFAEGMRVGHARYGKGTILKSTMTRSGEEIVIRFDTAGVKIFAVADAALEILG
jgi:DNA helicase II / ATP-dependent DNA helicase PcrA